MSMIYTLITIAGLLGTRAAVAQDIFIQGGTVVNSDCQFSADVHIANGKIVAVGTSLKGATVIRAKGKYVMPGGIDPHTHLDMPFMGEVSCDSFLSGQRAALAGGTTMHIDFAQPVDHDLLAGLRAWQTKAAQGVMDYGFHMIVTSWSDKVAKDMETLATHHGISSFKFFLAYKGIFQISDGEFIAGLQRCKELGALAMVHAENGDAIVEGQRRVFDAGIHGPEGHPLSRPAIIEAEATARAIRLAAWVNTPLYVVHVMSRDAMEEVAAARRRGWRVVGEALASGLGVDDRKLWDEDFVTAASYVMSPPLRGPTHRAALQDALTGGVLQLVGTDHAAFNSSQKAMGATDFRKIPNGVNGIEERMHVTWQEMVVSGKLSPSDFVRVTSTAAAQHFGLYPAKGVIAEGADADVIVLDPSVTHTLSAAGHHSRMDTNIYEGYRVGGKVTTTISRGRLVWHNGKLNVAPGSGRYVARPTHGPLFEGLAARDALWVEEQFPYGATPVLRAPVRVVEGADGSHRVEPEIVAADKDEL